MLVHYLKTAFRNFSRNKLYFTINIIGLAVGISASLLLAKYAGFNLTIDNFHQQKDNIVLVEQREFKAGVQSEKQPSTYWGAGKMAVDLYSEIKAVARFTPNVEMLVMAMRPTGEQVGFNESRICSVDTTFFNIFSFQALAGNAEMALASPNSIVLTHSMAKKYFGDSDPIGQTITTRVSWGEESSYKVTCVIPDPPDNSSFQFDFFVGASGNQPSELHWNDPSYPTYLLLNEGVALDELSDKMNRDIGQNPALTAAGKNVNFSLHRLSDTSMTTNDKMLSMVGILILIISWINFINLSIGSAQARSKETGVRKVVGANQKQIIGQFVLECILINGLALILAVIIFILFRPLLEVNGNKVLPLFNDSTSINWIFATIFVAGAIISSVYPAFIMSSMNPVNSLKGKLTQGRKSMTFRIALVIAQFTASVVAVIGVFIVSDQLDFFQKQDLKINVNHIVAIKAPKDVWEGKMERLASFKNEAMNLSMVENAASCTTLPGLSYRHEMNFGLTTSADRYLYYVNDVDANYFPLFEVKFLAGQNYNIDTPGKNRGGIILNKAAVKALNIANVEDAIGQTVTETEEGNTYEILGVVDDYHQMSLKYEILPQAFRFNRNRGDITIKIRGQNYTSIDDLQNCIASLKNIWAKIYPDQAFEYSFLDARFNDEYHAEIAFQKLFTWFTGLSLIIACLGLFGLSLLLSVKRKGEVGIRKVFGASSTTILGLFIRDYLIQMLISIALGAPIAYFVMKSWLESFIYQTPIHVTSFLIPCALLIVICVLTIAYHTIRASLANPVKTLREQ